MRACVAILVPVSGGLYVDGVRVGSRANRGKKTSILVPHVMSEVGTFPGQWRQVNPCYMIATSSKCSQVMAELVYLQRYFIASKSNEYAEIGPR